MAEEPTQSAPDVGHLTETRTVEFVYDGPGIPQESDFLENLPKGAPLGDSVTDQIRLVSLGCVCGPKLSFQKIGRGAETLPFDWIRTRLDGILHFMRTDFEGFFDFVTKEQVPGCNMTMYRAYYHSFWHDDPTDEGMREKYGRRIARFREIDARFRPVLFVRAVGTTSELERAVELLDDLRVRFGEMACLLLILDFQRRANGPAVVEGHNNLLVYFLEGGVHEVDVGPYQKPVKVGLDWAVGRPLNAMRFPSLEQVSLVTDPTHWGFDGLGGLKAFEESKRECPADQEHQQLPVGAALAAKMAGEEHQPFAMPRRALESDVLEKRQGFIGAPEAANDGIILVSLGCCCGPKLTFQSMGRGAETLPFDWIRTSHEAIVCFLANGFDGFFDYTTKAQVPGVPGMTMYRDRCHSFWHDDPSREGTREKYGRRIARLNDLGSSGAPTLYVRAVASTEELGQAGELLKVLEERHREGEAPALLLVVDFQRRTLGPHVVQGCPNLMAYFLGGDARCGESAAAPYRKAVECALGWVRGDLLEAQGVSSLEALQRCADESHRGFVGLGGLYAFEDLSPERRDLEGPSCASFALSAALG